MRRSISGAPSQAGARSARVVGRLPQFSLLGVREAVVLEVLYADDPKNRRKSCVEYKLRDLQTGSIVDNAVLESIAFGVDDGDETVLRAASKNTSGGDLNEFTRAKDTDGDHVRYTFTEGASTTPVITGVIPQRGVTWAATRKDGRRRLIRNAGTELEIKSDGEFVVTRGGTSLVVNKDSNVTLKHKSGAQLSIDDNGNVTLNGGPQVKIQDGSLGIARLNDPVASNTELATFFAQIVAVCTALQGAVGNFVPAIVLPTPPGSVIAAISDASKKATCG